MTISTSKYLKRNKNQWREIIMSEDWMREAVYSILRQHKYIKSTEELERVIVTPLEDGTYGVTYAICKERRSEVTG